MLHMAIPVLVLLALVLGAFGTPWQRVSRMRLDRFARRQSLPITVENGPLVIRYLATTRRWRGGGLLLGLVAALCWPLVTSAQVPPGRVSIGFLALFAGWFAGALVAEWRVSSAARQPGRRRSAALEPRRLADYLPWTSRTLPTAAWIVLIMTELSGLGGVAARHPTGIPVALLWLGLTGAVGAVILAVGRQILVRPQRYTDDGLITADDALRSRSLHVLAGSSLAIAGYLLGGLVHILMPYSSVLTEGAAGAIGAIGFAAAPIFGLIVATGTTAPIRRARRPVLDGVS